MSLLWAVIFTAQKTDIHIGTKPNANLMTNGIK